MKILAALLQELPEWLTVLTEEQLVGAALALAVTRLFGPAARLLSWELDRVRLEDTWVTRHDVAYQDGGGTSTVRIRGEHVPPGASPPATRDGAIFVESVRLICSVDKAPADALPGLEELSDPASVLSLVNNVAGRAGGPRPGLWALAVDSEVVRLKPGNRATARLTLKLPPDAPADWPAALFAKLYKDGQGAAQWEGLSALWAAGVGRGLAALPEPFAYLPDRRLLLMGPVEQERNLKKGLRAALRGGDESERQQFEEFLRRTGYSLAAIHRSGATAGEVRAFSHELADLREQVDQVDAVLPGFGSSCAPLLDHLAKLDAQRPAEPVVPSHGSFRPGQVLVAGDALGFIDFDGYCQAEPALDVGLFSVELRSLASDVLGPGSETEVDRLAAIFVDAYRERAPVSPVRLGLWGALDAFDKYVTCFTKVKPERLVSERRELVRLVERELAVSG